MFYNSSVVRKHTKGAILGDERSDVIGSVVSGQIDYSQGGREGGRRHQDILR